MERQCMLCGMDIREDDINEALAWEGADELGWPAPVRETSPVAYWDYGCGWVHYECAEAYGTGLTPEAWHLLVEDEED
jgi:hypothetical protein